MKDKKRFQAVLWEFLRTRFSLTKETAADFTIMMIESRAPFEAINFDHGQCIVSTKQFGLRRRSAYVVRTCEKLLQKGWEAEDSRVWIAASFAAGDDLLSRWHRGEVSPSIILPIHDLGWDVSKFFERLARLQSVTADEMRHQQFESTRPRREAKRRRQISSHRFSQ